MKEKCAFEGCGTRTPLHRFRFPTDNSKRKAWITQIRLSRMDSKWTPNPSSFICDLHIDPDDVLSYGFSLTVPIPPMIKESTIPVERSRKIHEKRRMNSVAAISSLRAQLSAQSGKAKRPEIGSEEDYALLGFSFSALVYVLAKLREPTTMARCQPKLQDDLMDIQGLSATPTRATCLAKGKIAEAATSKTIDTPPIKILDIRSLLRTGTPTLSSDFRNSFSPQAPIVVPLSSTMVQMRYSNYTYPRFNPVPTSQRQRVVTSSKFTSTWDLAFISCLDHITSNSRSVNIHLHARVSQGYQGDDMESEAGSPEPIPSPNGCNSHPTSPEPPSSIIVSSGLDPCEDEMDDSEFLDHSDQDMSTASHIMEICEGLDIQEEEVSNLETDSDLESSVNPDHIRSCANAAASEPPKTPTPNPSKLSVKRYKCTRCPRVVSSTAELTLHLATHPPLRIQKAAQISHGLASGEFRAPVSTIKTYSRIGGSFVVPVPQAGPSSWRPAPSIFDEDDHSKYVISEDELAKVLSQVQIEHSYSRDESLRKTFELRAAGYPCSVCSRVYKNNAARSLHMKRKHINPKPKKSKIKVWIPETLEKYRKTFTCKTCDEVCVSSKDYTFHKQETRHDIQACPICSEEFSSNFKYLLHVKSHTDACHKCPFCGKVFPFGHQLTMHVRKKHEELKKRRQCSQCDMICRTNRALKRHVVRIHDPIPKFKCSYCSKPFLFADVLKVHEQRHSGRKSRTLCPHCGIMKFTETLKLHIQSVHEGVRYKCKFCGVKISPWVSYRYHLRERHPEEAKTIKKREEAFTIVHLATEPYRSHQVFRRPAKHKKPRDQADDGPEEIEPDSDEPVFRLEPRECPICKFKFVQLEKHMLVHSSEYDYACTFCPYRAKSYSTLYVHVRQVHMTLRKGTSSLRRSILSAAQAEGLTPVNETAEQSTTTPSETEAFNVNAEVLNRAWLKCPYADCQEVFDEFAKVRKHLSTYHPDFEGYRSKKEPKDRAHGEKGECPECGKLILMPSMKRHIESVHHNMHSMDCDVCKKTFSNKDVLKLHQTTKYHKKLEKEQQKLSDQDEDQSDSSDS